MVVHVHAMFFYMVVHDMLFHDMLVHDMVVHDMVLHAIFFHGLTNMFIIVFIHTWWFMFTTLS